MLVNQTMQCRSACRRLLRVVANNSSRGRRRPHSFPGYADDNLVAGDGLVARRRRSSCSVAPATSFPSPDGDRRSRRNFSTDGITVIPDSDPSPSSSSATQPAAMAGSKTADATVADSSPIPESSHQSQCQIISTADSTTAPTSTEELQGAHDLFQQITTESQALLRNNANAITSDEIVATVDYFLILVNSLDLEKYLEMVQSLQVQRDAMCEIRTLNSIIDGEKGGVEGNLQQAIKSMSQLHHVFLTMVETCIPLSPSITKEDAEEKFKNSHQHSDVTVGRALQLTRRAEELGMPMHRPLYQRLANGVVLTSSLTTLSEAKPSLAQVPSTVEHSAIDEESNSTKANSSVLTGQSQQQIKEGLNVPPLALKLMVMFRSASSALKVESGEHVQKLAEDLLTEPFLLMLKTKQFKEANGLLHGWRTLFGKKGVTVDIDLISLLGENSTLDALEIAKGWLGDGARFEEEVQKNPHANHLSGLLEVALTEILKGRKERADIISLLMEDGLGVAVEYSPNDDEEEEEDDDDLETGETELQAATPTPDFSGMTDFTSSYSPSGLDEGTMEPSHFSSTDSDDKYSMSVFSDDDDDANTTNIMNKQEGDTGLFTQGEKETENYTIIEGLSNSEARQSIYLRNGDQWVLPDAVSILEEWNQGNKLTFTPEFELYLGRQIMKEVREDDEFPTY